MHRMRNWLFGMMLVAIAAPVSAADFGHTRKDRMQINDAFNAMANMCSNSFGFTRLPKKADTLMADKMEAYLLLAPSADSVIRGWADIGRASHALDRARSDDALADRMADFLIAAKKDPDSYSRAEALWVETFRAPIETVVGACRLAVSDPFIGANYLTGNGSADQYEDQLKAMFAEDLKRLN